MSKGEEKQTHEFLRGSAIPAYVHASNHTRLEDFTIQVFSRLQMFTIDFKVSMNLYNKRLSLQSLHPKCFSHLYTHNLMRNKNYNNETLFKSGYTN